MKLNRTWAMVVAIVMALTLSLSTTLAYLQDSDSDVNVMTLGNVYIENVEQERVNDDDKQTELKPFVQFKDLYPAVYEGSSIPWAPTDEWVTPGNQAWKVVEDNDLVVDKFVSVKNTGKSDAYVRTIFAIEVGPEAVNAPYVHLVHNGANVSGDTWTWEWLADAESEDAAIVQIGTDYFRLYMATYTGILPAGETTIPSLKQIYMDKTATNENVEAYGETYDILLVSQAVQAAGFSSPEQALEEAFGNPLDHIDTLFDDVKYPVMAEDGSPLHALMTELNDGTDITKKVTEIIFGRVDEYPEIVSGGYESKTEDGATAYYVPDGSNYKVYMLSEGEYYLPANSKGLFQDMSNLKTVDTSNLNFSQVENALGMFANCSNLETLDTADWDMSNVTNMQSLFYGCNKLKDIDVSNWDTSSCTNMRMVFFRCYALDFDAAEMDLSGWDVSNVTNFYSMFKHARGVKSLDLSTWDTSSATNMSHMFANIDGLETLDLSSFDTSNVTDMSWMFYGASKLTTIWVGDKWTTANVDPSTPTAFYNNQALVGGAGTTWLDVCDMANPNRPWESSAKLVYAIVDGGEENPGLLTLKTH